MWAHILRDQLAVDAATFWACVTEGALPARSTTVPANPRALPLHLLNELVTRLGMKPEAAAALTLAEANDAIAKFWREHA
jgi:hypothetical protein